MNSTHLVGNVPAHARHKDKARSQALPLVILLRHNLCRCLRNIQTTCEVDIQCTSRLILGVIDGVTHGSNAGTIDQTADGISGLGGC